MSKDTKSNQVQSQALENNAAEVLNLLKQVRDKLDAMNLARYTAEDRVHSAGRLRDKEENAMLNILDAVDSNPNLFVAIADRDHGVSATVVETGPAREAIRRRQVLKPVADTLEAIYSDVSDDLLLNGELAKEVTAPAYAIARACASVDDKIRRTIAPAIDFYASKRRANKTPTK